MRNLSIYSINSDGILIVEYITELFVVIGFTEKNGELYPIGYEIEQK